MSIPKSDLIPLCLIICYVVFTKKSENPIKTGGNTAVDTEVQTTSVTGLQDYSSTESHKKVKVTYNIDVASAEALEDVYHRLRQMAGRKRSTTISRSDVVNHALREALADLEKNGRNSSVARALLGLEYKGE